jgi:hypothetical protein
VRAFGTDEGPTYKAAEGIGAFALFYIAAQAAERLVELVLPSFEWVPGFGTAKKKVIVDQKIAAAYDPAVTGNGTKTPEQEAADAQADVDQARANRAVVVFGLTAALGMWACGYLEADFLTAVGVTLSIPAGSTFPDTTQQVFAMAVTGLIVGGGSKGLHDLITNISKSKTNNDTPPETGGAP